MIFLFDIDGTIADLSHRLHHIRKEKPDWASFFAACSADEPIQDVIDLLNYFSHEGHVIYLMSGRSSEVRGLTEIWLDNREVSYDDLYMRKAGDHRPDSIVKSEMLDQLLLDHALSISDISGVFDDRDQVVKMYRERGLRVYQVANGNF